MINVDELNFSQKVRERKHESGAGIPVRLCEIVLLRWQNCGPPKITPLVAGMKLDISILHRSGVN